MRDILNDDQLKGNTVESKKKLKPSFIANPHQKEHKQSSLADEKLVSVSVNS